jgi:hypothetical protein
MDCELEPEFNFIPGGKWLEKLFGGDGGATMAAASDNAGFWPAIKWPSLSNAGLPVSRFGHKQMPAVRD